MAVDAKCLACAHHPLPVCDGTGVRLVRDGRDQVVDVEVCPRWPASWAEPVAFYEARAEHRIDAIPTMTVPERIWPAVQAEIARTTRDAPPADDDDRLEDLVDNPVEPSGMSFAAEFGVMFLIGTAAFAVIFGLLYLAGVRL